MVLGGLETLAGTVLKGALLLSVGWIVLRFRRLAAATRHALLATLLLSHLALPVLSPLLPAWEVPILDAGVAGLVDGFDTALRAGVRGGTASDRPRPGDGGPADRGSDGEAWEAMRSVVSAPGGPGVGAGEPVRAVTRRTTGRGGPTWASFLFLTWTAGAALGLLRLAAAHRKARRRARAARPLGEPEWRRDLARATARAGLARRPSLRVAPGPGSPGVAGVIRPAILVPAEAAGWSAARRWVVLLHETAHVARRDPLVRLLGDVAGALFWFDPLVHWARRALRREGERACDDAVIRAGVRPSEYVLELAAIARGLRDGVPRAAAVVAMTHPGELEARARHLLTDGREAIGSSRWTRVVLSMGFLAALPPLAALAPGPATAGPSHAPASPAPWERSGALLPSGCAWAGGAHWNRWVRGSEGALVWDVGWEGEECEVRVRGEGLVGPAPAGGPARPAAAPSLVAASAGSGATPLAPVPLGGSMEVRLRHGERESVLALHRRDDGGLDRSLRVDDAPVPWDEPAGRWWLGRLAVELDRHTAFDVDRRLPELLARHGTEGVLEEIGRMQGDHAAGVWLEALVTERPLTPSEVEAVLRAAAAGVRNDAVMSGLLRSVLRHQPLETLAARRAFDEAYGALRTRAAREGVGELLRP